VESGEASVLVLAGVGQRNHIGDVTAGLSRNEPVLVIRDCRAGSGGIECRVSGVVQLVQLNVALFTQGDQLGPNLINGSPRMHLRRAAILVDRAAPCQLPQRRYVDSAVKDAVANRAHLSHVTVVGVQRTFPDPGPNERRVSGSADDF
jgi:hypothetical protein